jgi:hypothetical protein
VLPGDQGGYLAAPSSRTTLLTPFTDDVDLPECDRKTSAAQAKSQQAKGFERVEVTFETPGPAAPNTG